MGGQDAMEQYKVCIGPNLTCMNDLMNRMGQFNHVEYKGEQVKCRSSCEDQINSLFVTTSSYPNRKERERESERERERERERDERDSANPRIYQTLFHRRKLLGQLW
jgi:hypothetical protein